MSFFLLFCFTMYSLLVNGIFKTHIFTFLRDTIVLYSPKLILLGWEKPSVNIKLLVKPCKLRGEVRQNLASQTLLFHIHIFKTPEIDWNKKSRSKERMDDLGRQNGYSFRQISGFAPSYWLNFDPTFSCFGWRHQLVIIAFFNQALYFKTLNSLSYLFTELKTAFSSSSSSLSRRHIFIV